MKTREMTQTAKENRSIGHWLLLLCFLFTNSAAAFYNPSTGRWLNRDPAEEQGGAAFLTFVQNNPIDNWDYLGLCDPVSGATCGPDVTDPLNQTLQRIKTRYQQAWGGFQKYRSCVTLYGLYAIGAWGVDKITQLGFAFTGAQFPFGPPAQQGTPPPCDTTVSYQGKCYQSSDVNYIMWGTINRLCFNSFGGKLQPVVWSLPWSLTAVIAWKGVHHDPVPRLMGALLFTTAGYTANTACLGPAVEKGCTVNPANRVPDRIFRYQWYPYERLWPARPWPFH